MLRHHRKLIEPFRVSGDFVAQPVAPIGKSETYIDENRMTLVCRGNEKPQLLIAFQVANLCIVVMFAVSCSSALQAQSIGTEGLQWLSPPQTGIPDWGASQGYPVIASQYAGIPNNTLGGTGYTVPQMPWPTAALGPQFAYKYNLSPPKTAFDQLWCVVEDHQTFYSRDSLEGLFLGILATAPIANTRLDDEFRRVLQAPLGGSNSNQWTRIAEPMGNGIYTLPVMAAACLIGNQSTSYEGRRFGEWGERSLRTFLVGAPPLLIGQLALGGSRPGETNHDSYWRPFADENGMSGHSFMGSLPFINAAKMSHDRRYKILFYSASAIVPLSRVADDAHYPSQAFLGWWVAYVAASAVDRTNQKFDYLTIRASAPDGSSGISFEFRR